MQYNRVLRLGFKFDNGTPEASKWQQQRSMEAVGCGCAMDRWIDGSMDRFDRSLLLLFCVVDSGSVGFRVGLVPGFSAGLQQKGSTMVQFEPSLYLSTEDSCSINTVIT